MQILNLLNFDSKKSSRKCIKVKMLLPTYLAFKFVLLKQISSSVIHYFHF